jgi:hypothetical protein
LLEGAKIVAHDHSYAEISLPALEVVNYVQPEQTKKEDAATEVVEATPASGIACSTSSSSTPVVVGSLAQGLEYAKEFLACRVKSSTKNQYDRVYQVWQDFCSENGLLELEAGHEALAACLSLVMKSSGSLSKVTMLSAAVANEHRRNLKDSPTDHRCIGDLLRSFRSASDSSRQPVLPITEFILKQMVDKVYHPSHGRDGQKASTVLWRTVWRVVMEFHTLGRYSDIVKLKREGGNTIYLFRLVIPLYWVLYGLFMLRVGQTFVEFGISYQLERQGVQLFVIARYSVF